MKSFAVVMGTVSSLKVFTKLLGDIIVREIIWFHIRRFRHDRWLSLGVVMKECASPLLELLAISPEPAGPLWAVVLDRELGSESAWILMQECALPLHKFITVVAEFAWPPTVAALHIY